MKKLDVNWELIRVEYIHGEPFEALAKKYGINSAAIRQRCSRGKWAQARPETHVARLLQQRQDAEVQAAESIAKSLLERGKAYQDMVFDKASKLVATAKLTAPKTWKDAEIADKIARRAAGLDTAETQINTIIGVSGFDDSPVVDVETSHTPAILDAELE